jgi:hypothetical protein
MPRGDIHESAAAGFRAMSNKSSIHFPPAFIVGAPRSGTTLLVNMVGAHPLLAPIYETRFLRNLMALCQRLCWFHGTSWSRRCARVAGEPWIKAHLAKELARYRSKAIKYNTKAIEYNALPTLPAGAHGWEFPFGPHCIRYEMAELIAETDKWLQGVSEGRLACEDIHRTAREYIDNLFAIHCARLKKPHWVNKTPGFLAYLEPLAKLYPGSRCIHILRDGRDVVASNQSLGWGPREVRRWARRWKSLIQKGRAGAARAQFGYMEIRYEELVASPRETMRKVGRFYELDSDSDIMAESMQVSKEQKTRWRATWSLSARRDFAREAGDLLIELGYEKNSDWIALKD